MGELTSRELENRAEGLRRLKAGEVLTPEEVAAIFRVDRKTVHRWAVAGYIRSFRTPGGHRRFTTAAVQEALLRGERIEEQDRQFEKRNKER
jgi:excisionase family DNA binding protein